MADIGSEPVRKRVPMVIRVDDDLHALLKEKARAEERTMASAIRAALRRYVTS